MIRVSAPRDSTLFQALERHPHVCEVSESTDAAVHFSNDDTGHVRTLRFAKPGESCSILELEDNNPVVCSDTHLLPTAEISLALIAMGPLLRAGLIKSDPVLSYNFSGNDAHLRQVIGEQGFAGQPVIQFADESPDILGLSLMVEIDCQITPESIDWLYQECFSPAFYVHEISEDDLTPEFVLRKPSAFYHLRVSPAEPTYLLTVIVLCDRCGKVGDVQWLHAFNIMNGFEESLGITP